MKNLLEKFANSNCDINFARFAVILIFCIFGNFKWFEFEVEALKPLFSTTWLNFLSALLGSHGASYFLGVVETVAYISLIIGYFKPKAGVLGSLIVIVTALTTLSLLPQLGKPDGFILKDIFTLSLGLILLKHDLLRLKSQNKDCKFS
ncbi:DUF417 family protein [Campylobacter sp. CCUG 57310]|uniref:DUF417 family protein n=1 Tax=Campylobacter sp. CCUG 57310 TaxID=2517362 RepID=UPI001563B107|nr:DUF417 family protein [Campylobacter sp. CCUG 57310]QKF93114.1 DUF417 domain-containing membrane protein [Campylobacter sp. CCUG 57310]